MECDVVQDNQNKSTGGTPGLRPYCIATPVGFYFGGLTMKQIPLTKGQFALVDDDDYDWLMQWKWFAINSHGIWYAARNSKYIRGKPRKMIQMHREIMQPPDDMEIHHKRNCGLNNQRHNMAIVTHRVNCYAQRKSRSTKVRGVSKRSDCDSYEAQITAYGKHHHLGLYKTVYKAKQAYDHALNCVKNKQPIVRLKDIQP